MARSARGKSRPAHSTPTDSGLWWPVPRPGSGPPHRRWGSAVGRIPGLVLPCFASLRQGHAHNKMLSNFCACMVVKNTLAGLLESILISVFS